MRHNRFRVSFKPLLRLHPGRDRIEMTHHTSLNAAITSALKLARTMHRRQTSGEVVIFDRAAEKPLTIEQARELLASYRNPQNAI